MATQTKENYLKAIYFLGQNADKITLSALSKKMGVSTPTVNSMVKKLEAKGWVDYQKYKPLLLTSKGKLEAALIVRKHRLTEMFLTKIMSFGWEEVHEIAEEMEHLQSEALFDRMDEILGFPTVDPHGSPIPSKSGKLTKKDYFLLSNLSSGECGRLCAVSDSSMDLLVYLNDKKIKLGTTFEVLKIEAFDQTMELEYDGIKTSLSHKVSQILMVEKI